MRLAWVTDIHLNYVLPADREKFYASLASLNLGALLVGGDIGESDSVTTFLNEIESAVRLPVFFARESRFLSRFHRSYPGRGVGPC